MAHFKKVIALILTLCVVCTAGIISVNAANIDDDSDTSASSGITVHYYSESGTPYVYYWNSLPQNIETATSYKISINQISVTNEDSSTETASTRNGRVYVYKNGDANYEKYHPIFLEL